LLLGLLSRAAAAEAPLRLGPCELEHPLRLTVLPAECGVLQVAENPQDPAGRHIGLHVARVSAISRRKQPDPLFVLAGGPGASAQSFYASVASAFARVRRDRDIVLVDQRGTGQSNPLVCAQDEDFLLHATDAQIAASTRRCLADLGARASVAYYTTSVAVADLERVRAALGYERINLYGASYGTRVAQHYLRRFPQRTRSVILDGVVPVGVALGPRTPLDAENALVDILARCAHDSTCHAAFGDPLADYRAVRAALASHAVAVSVPDPASGARVSLDFGPEQLATVLRLASYTAEYAALLPLLLDAAAAHRDYAPLAAQFLLGCGRHFVNIFPVGVQRQGHTVLFDPRAQHAGRGPGGFFFSQVGVGHPGSVVDHVHQTAARTALLEPGMKASVQLHQLAEMFLARATATMGALPSTDAAP